MKKATRQKYTVSVLATALDVLPNQTLRAVSLAI
jgi:hypothetical protein